MKYKVLLAKCMQEVSEKIILYFISDDFYRYYIVQMLFL